MILTLIFSINVNLFDHFPASCIGCFGYNLFFVIVWLHLISMVDVLRGCVFFLGHSEACSS
jgi:hypothetical protein